MSLQWQNLLVFLLGSNFFLIVKLILADGKKGERKVKVLLIPQSPSPESIITFACVHSNAFWKKLIYWETCINENVIFGDCCFLGTTGSFHGWSIQWEVMAGRSWGWQGQWELFLMSLEADLEFYAWSDRALERSSLVMVGRWNRAGKTGVQSEGPVILELSLRKANILKIGSWLVLRLVHHLDRSFSNLKVHTSHQVILLMYRFWFSGTGVGHEVLHFHQSPGSADAMAHK